MTSPTVPSLVWLWSPWSHHSYCRGSGGRRCGGGVGGGGGGGGGGGSDSGSGSGWSKA